MKDIMNQHNCTLVVNKSDGSFNMNFTNAQYPIPKLNLTNPISAVNLVQMSNMKAQMREVQESFQAMESHFIHESIEQILDNKLNLHFIHHQDMPRVIREISWIMNLSVDEIKSSIPMVEIITKLLVRQQINSVQSENGVIIGKMIFTSYFAAPTREQDPFSIY
jgi:hypothetical protein